MFYSLHMVGIDKPAWIHLKAFAQAAMIIEFVGLPGVGKSTIAQVLEEQGCIRICISSRVELLFRNVQFLVIHPIAFFSLLYRVCRAGLRQGRLFHLLRSAFLSANARIIKARHSRAPAIVDTGHLQAFLSLSLDELADSDIGSFRKFLPEPEQVFFLTVNETERQDRLRQRNHWPREDEQNPYNALWEAHLVANAEQLRSSLLAANSGNCRIFDTASNPDVTAAIMKSEITGSRGNQ